MTQDLSKITLYLILLFVTGCTAPTTIKNKSHLKSELFMTNESLYELPQNCDFTEVGNNSGLEFSCSPQLKDRLFSTFQGILINAPKKVTWPKNADLDEREILPTGEVIGSLKLMVAGLLKLPRNTLDLDGDLAERVLLVAVNQETADTFSSTMIPFGFKGPRPDVPVDPNPVITDTKQYFNIDLIQNLNIPLANATYTVYAILGDYKSNVLTVTTELK